ncbi:Bromodomain-containing protein 2 [Porphyridium purpureum]|uniref:Bromodomain-containing protein 2 n=1 Tax=Porphyridium purpureum TaxID=35688 RepID=A0A5J4ZAH1_PORPP|nr:Bromodomain-containing protein 2 [Porphyridium purpureum]|eukprot:POR2482..scf295_1
MDEGTAREPASGMKVESEPAPNSTPAKAEEATLLTMPSAEKEEEVEKAAPATIHVKADGSKGSAGAMGTSDWIEELEIPAEYNFASESHADAGSFSREMDLFSLTRDDGKLASFLELDGATLVEKQRFVLRGWLVPPSTTMGSQPQRLNVQVRGLGEWCIEYGVEQSSLWVHSQHAWYKIIQPAKEYEDAFDAVRTRYEICARAFILASTMSSKAATYRMVCNLLVHPYQNMRGYSEADINDVKEFIIDQAANLGDQCLIKSGFIKTLIDRQKKEQAQGANAPASAGAGPGAGSETGSQTGEKPRRASLGFWSSPAPEEIKRYEPSEPLPPGGDKLLMDRLRKYVQSLSKQSQARAFALPVDPVRDGCPDYLDIVKEPMDLWTVETKIKARAHKPYSPIECARDLRKIWDNCRLYNPPTSALVRLANACEARAEERLHTWDAQIRAELGAETGLAESTPSIQIAPVLTASALATTPVANSVKNAGSNGGLAPVVTGLSAAAATPPVSRASGKPPPQPQAPQASTSLVPLTVDVPKDEPTRTSAAGEASPAAALPPRPPAPPPPEKLITPERLAAAPRQAQDLIARLDSLLRGSPGSTENHAERACALPTCSNKTRLLSQYCGDDCALAYAGIRADYMVLPNASENGFQRLIKKLAKQYRDGLQLKRTSLGGDPKPRGPKPGTKKRKAPTMTSSGARTPDTMELSEQELDRSAAASPVPRERLPPLKKASIDGAQERVDAENERPLDEPASPKQTSATAS